MSKKNSKIYNLNRISIVASILTDYEGQIDTLIMPVRSINSIP